MGRYKEEYAEELFRQRDEEQECPPMTDDDVDALAAVYGQ